MLVSKKKCVDEHLHSELKVDTWKLLFDQDENMKEVYDGKKTMEEVKEIKYLGVIILQSGSNMPDIINKRNRAIGTQKLIMNLVKGLGNYTFECGCIYLRSLLRSSILYGTEIMSHITEKEMRAIEQMEEDQMRKLFNTDRSCPLHIMYLESGLVPARYLIMGNRAIFLQYILQEAEDSNLLQMLNAQIKYPIKNDWNNEVKSALAQLKINISFEEIKNMKKFEFKKMVKKHIQNVAFSELVAKQKPGTKGCEIKYGEKLEMADYLLPNKNIKLEEQREIFEILARANRIPSNWGKQTLCETGCSEVLNNEHILRCLVLNENRITNIEYIYNGSVEEKLNTLNIFKRNIKRRKMYLPLDSGQSAGQLIH